MAVDKNMKILVVDDFKTMRRIVTGLLNQLGFENIDEAIDGESALQKLTECKFDLVISDWNMEPMSGFDMLKNLRGGDCQHKNIPFILITAESKPENVIKAKEAGVNNYIVKPFNADTLKQKLTAVLGDF
tara:strand:+ start:192 stop:581 length:390 start_codon:yes stop_codon:yes gene_type:complete